MMDNSNKKNDAVSMMDPLTATSMSASSSSSSSLVYSCSSLAEFEATLASADDRLVVVDCYAPWCPPCRQMSPIFERLASEYTDVVFIKVNVEQVPQISKLYRVWALPTFLFLRSGHTQGSIMGANVTKLRQGLENNGYVSFCGSCLIL